MIRKMLIAMTLAMILSFFIIPQRDSIVSVFRMTEEPLVISKGRYGQSLVVEISFTHDGLDEWIQSLKQPYPLLMLDADWINRSPKVIEIIKVKNIPTGLLGKNGKEDEYSIQAFKKDLAIYEKHFGQKPLWFMTKDYEYSQKLKQAVFNEEINLLSPSHVYTEGEQYGEVKGAIITLPLHEETKPKFKNITTFISQQKFISLEENIFGYSIKSTKMP